MEISKKVAILGSHAVGKTSLISRFVEQKFPEKYLTTIGLKVDKKTVKLDKDVVDLVIWDIAGQDEIASIPHYYLNGCSGYIFVVDLTRPSTYENIQSQLLMLRGILRDAEVVIAANKVDLIESEEEQQEILHNISITPDFCTSAKTGEHVDDIFHKLAEKMISVHESR
ncbi:MAG: Rab family GTPase [Bacteroidota bacterium]